MALFTTIEEVANILPINIGGTDFISTIPITKDAEDYYLKKILSNSVFDILQSEYDYFITNNTLQDPSYEKLLLKARPVVVFMGYHDGMSMVSFQVSDSGTYTQSSEDSMPLKQWQYKELRTMLSTKGMRAIEDLYQFLEENITTLQCAIDWKNSTAYPVYNKFFIRNTKEYQDCVHIGGSRWTYLQLLPYMEDQELLIIKSLIGPEYFDELKSKILSNTLDPLDTEALLYIRKCVANYTLHYAVDILAVQIDTDGVTVLSSRGSDEVRMREGASDSRIEALKNESKKTGAKYSEMLMSFLIKNASSIPTWYASSTYTTLVDGMHSTENFNNDTSKTSFFM